MAELASVEDVAALLPFEMTPEEERECLGALIDLSDDARHYGKANWTDPDTAPQEVINLVIRAARRHMKNYEGYISNRAGDEAVAWAQPKSTDEVGSARFSPTEQEKLGQLAGRRVNELHAVDTFAWQTEDRGHPTVGYTGDGFPMWSDPLEPW